MADLCTVLIPALNAEATLPTLLQRLKHIPGIRRTIVVDDGSADNTAVVAADHGAHVIRHGTNKGKGAALRTGFAAALSDQYTLAVLTMDADLQHDPADVRTFLEACRPDGAQIIVGRRKKLGSGMPLARILSNAITSFLVSARTGYDMPDSQCGYRLIHREVLERVVPESDGFEAETEMLIRAAKLGFRVGWIPVQTVYAGEPSSMTYWKTTKLFVRTLLREY